MVPIVTKISLHFPQVQMACQIRYFEANFDFFFLFETIIHFEFIFSGVKHLSWHLFEVEFDVCFVSHSNCILSPLHVELARTGLDNSLLPFIAVWEVWNLECMESRSCLHLQEVTLRNTNLFGNITC